MSVESDSPDVFVESVQHGSESEYFGHGRAWGDGTTFAGLQASDALAKVAVNQSDLNILDDSNHQAFNRLFRFVLHVDIEADLFVVIKQFAIQSQLQVEFAVGESEALGHHSTWLLGARSQRSVLHLSYYYYYYAT